MCRDLCFLDFTCRLLFFIFYLISILLYRFYEKKKEKYIWEAERGRERDTRQRCLLILSAKRYIILKIWGPELWMGKILVIRSIDRVLGLLISNADFIVHVIIFFFSLDFIKRVY